LSADGDANQATFRWPTGLAVDSQFLYVADTQGGKVRKIATTTNNHEVSTLASNLDMPVAAAVDSSGYIYVAEYRGRKITKFSPLGIKTTLADPGPVACVPVTGLTLASGASVCQYVTPPALKKPRGIAVNPTGTEIYAADFDSKAIYQINPSGTDSLRGFSIFAGSEGQAGTGNGQKLSARFLGPTAIARDNDGNLYVADCAAEVDISSRAIRKISASLGVVTTVRSDRGAPYEGIAVDRDQNIYTLDLSGNVQKITQVGAVSPIGQQQTISGIFAGLTMTANGAMYLANGKDLIWQLNLDGSSTPLAGILVGADGPGARVQFDHPRGMAVDSVGNAYTVNFTQGATEHPVKKISSTGVVTTLPGITVQGNFGVADASLTVDRYDNLYISDAVSCDIRKISPLGEITAVAGNRGTCGNVDSARGVPLFNTPRSIAIDTNGNIFVVDRNLNDYQFQIRKINTSGVVSTVMKSSTFSKFLVAADLYGNIYIAKGGTFSGQGSLQIRNADGILTPVAPLRYINASGNILNASGLAVDASGDAFVSYSDGPFIDKIASNGNSGIIAGSAGNSGHSNGVGAAASFVYPSSLAIDSLGRLYVADSGNGMIRIITP
jgi:hypothetical protein